METNGSLFSHYYVIVRSGFDRFKDLFGLVLNSWNQSGVGLPVQSADRIEFKNVKCYSATVLRAGPNTDRTGPDRCPPVALIFIITVLKLEVSGSEFHLHFGTLFLADSALLYGSCKCK